MPSPFPDVQPVLLWTDALVYLLITAVIGVGGMPDHGSIYSLLGEKYSESR